MSDGPNGPIGRRDFLRLAGATTAATVAARIIGSPATAASVPYTPGRTDWASISTFVSDPPFSFVYGGHASRTLLPAWPTKVESVSVSPERVQHSVTWEDRVSGLQVEANVVQYPGFAAREWTVWFTNTGTRRTPPLTLVLGADAIINPSNTATYILHHFNGSADQATDYAPMEAQLALGRRHLLYPFGGRPSNRTWPYFNLDWGKRGAMVAVGWPGQWTAELLPDASQGLVLRAGMTSADPQTKPYQDIEDAHLLATTLEPGEQVRTPLIVVMDWAAPNWSIAQNSWRRWMWQFNLPRYAGKLPTPILTTSGAISLYPDQSEELSTISEYAGERTTKDHGGFYTHWWVDAGWYAIPLKAVMFSTDPWFYGVGNWYPDPVRFPKGVKTTFEAAASHGMKSILWSEPERAMASTWIADNHPTWLLGPSGPVRHANEIAPDVSYLVNFGNPSALKWMIDHFDWLITTQGATGNGIDVFRQDFNMDPLVNWNAADPPGRRGMTQMRHVLGHLAFWDEMLQRHPGMWIDSCASGGRRNDLETMRRAVPLWRSDYQYDPTAAQCQTYGISFWLPYFGAVIDPQVTNGGQYGPADYVVRSAFAPCFISDIDPDLATAADWQLLRAANEEFLQIKDDLLYSDFYPLTGYSVSLDVWLAFQYNRPARGSGVVEVFRRPGSSSSVGSFRLQGLVADRHYGLKNLITDEVEVRTGASLMKQGLVVRLPRAPDAAIFSYVLGS